MSTPCPCQCARSKTCCGHCRWCHTPAAAVHVHSSLLPGPYPHKGGVWFQQEIHSPPASLPTFTETHRCRMFLMCLFLLVQMWVFLHYVSLNVIQSTLRRHLCFCSSLEVNMSGCTSYRQCQLCPPFRSPAALIEPVLWVPTVKNALWMGDSGLNERSAFSIYRVVGTDSMTSMNGAGERKEWA